MTKGSVVVTGGGRGIGRAIGALMVARGYDVVLTDIDGEGARRTAAEIGAVAGLEQDVRDEASHRAVAEEALRHGPLVAWFNNAGVGNDGAVMDLPAVAIEQLVQVNLMGVIWGMRAAMDAFGPAGGDVVNTASMSAHGPVPGLSVYAATKAAVVSLTTSVQVETPKHVRVHALCPDGVDTPMVEAMADHGRAKALVHSGGRLLTAEEAAEAAVSLVGTSRVVLSVPSWRAGLLRFTSVTPSISMKAEKLFLWEGRRRMRRAR
ncbi:MAG TPA: SDR family oxidoreductase [Nocardioidaceae bacterium]|nr:SDR family oxidoreductase [Nocardioidaceae bacterium]